MTANTELKRLAQRLIDIEALDGEQPISAALDEFQSAANPEAVLALIAENDAIRAAYMAAGEREHALRVERETLRKAVAYAIEMFSSISSGDGSGHADLGRAVLRIAGTAMGKGEPS